MTDLIARLEELATHNRVYVAVSHDDLPTILRALKVQQAAEAYFDGGSTLEGWSRLRAAVKGEQP